MPKFKVAHIRQQDIDLIIIPLDEAFKFKNEDDQQKVMIELQLRASKAGLAGTVVPVWDDGNGHMGFIAPSNWHPFFISIDMKFVAANINNELSW